MPTFADSRLPKPSSWDEFEKIVCSVAKIRWDNPDFTRYGRQGQAQDGVDVYGHDKSGALIGLQCKNTIGGLSNAAIFAEVGKAEAFTPALSKLYIATTAEFDATTQTFVRELGKSRRESGKFDLDILFWGDIGDELTRDPSRLYQHYPQLKPEVVMAPVSGPTADQALFRRFTEALPFDPAIRLLREHDFNTAFPAARVMPLHNFVDKWGTPNHEFLDSELADALKRFYSQAQALSGLFTRFTCPVQGNGVLMLSVFSDNLRAMGARPSHVIKEAKEINDASTNFVSTYEDFVRLCRSKLV